MGGTHVKGRTYTQLLSDLSLNYVANINVNTLGSTNISHSANKLNLNATLASMTQISSSSGSFSIGSEYEIVCISDENGNNGGADFIWKTKRSAGGSLIELMRLAGATGDLTVAGKLSNTGSARLVIGSNGGNTKGIAMASNTSTSWAIYMANTSSGNSFSNQTAPSL